MKKAVLHGTHQAFTIEQHEPPLATSEGMAQVALKAAALNHRDLWITKGLYAGLRFPCVLGSDGSGIFEGRNVIINPSGNWGDNPRAQGRDFTVLGLPDEGTFAELVCVPLSKVNDMPAHLTFETAAALPLAGLTAYRALFTKCQLTADDTVLITGVGGGVALFAFQFAVATGARVFVTSSSDEKIERAIALGAQGGANYRAEGWNEKLMNMTKGGFDVIIDSAAGEGFMSLIKMCKAGARVAFFGATRGTITQLDPRVIFWKQISIFGSTMGTDAEFQAMLDFVVKHKIVPVVDSVFALDQINEAFAHMDRGAQFGKIVIRI